MFRPVGDRVAVRPVDTPLPADRLVELVGHEDPPPVVGDVVSVGKGRCDECGNPLEQAIRPGMRVALRPTAVYQEVAIGGETLWIVRMGDVIGEIEPVTAAE